MAKKKKQRQSSASSDFESMVVAACLAERLVRGELGAETAREIIATEVSAWRTAARAAHAALETEGRPKRKKST